MAWQVGDEAWICDSAASMHMTPTADTMTNDKERNLKLRIADGTTRSIEGYMVIPTSSFGPETTFWTCC